MSKLLINVLRMTEQYEKYGIEAWEASRDLTMMRQDETGLWTPGTGRQRRRVTCPVCGDKVKHNEYCEGCSKSGSRYRGPETIAAPVTEKVEKSTKDKSFAERKHGVKR